ncbi:hypothetical protein THMIRHAS_04450 [Thiosulfatimonas sediminis]|uniref:Lipoprotein n=2 Tax=Thiosulfatimonas sediminis TaxID=2675054 RepID=A0A6F8PSG0_9GAMM|nr:hypothetical protein THMIRHAS_04450 [Thiosulfatimonas sediminis]
MRFSKAVLGSAMAAALLAGCQSLEVYDPDSKKAVVNVNLQPAVFDPDSKAPLTDAAKPKVAQLFEVHHDGRIYSFYDFAEYQSFLAVGETPFQLTRIGAGPKGETMVFGLTKDDKKKGEKTPAVMLMDGKADVAGEFYGEIKRHGRIYVFDNKADMDGVRQLGEAVFMYTEIGGGINGETVVYVLNKGNNKVKPVKLMEKYHAINAK